MAIRVPGLRLIRRRPRIAICFFGITRSLSHTLPSIEANVLTPARETGEVTVHAHFFRKTGIRSARTGEDGVVDPEEHSLISYDSLVLEPPDACLETHGFSAIAKAGDHWDDGLVSLGNLVHQLHSLNEVTKAALATEPEIVGFFRPDLEYHDSLSRGFRDAASMLGTAAFVPAWQAWLGGLNDRFAVCAGRRAAAAYGERIGLVPDYLRRSGGPLHSERLLRFAMLSAGVPVRTLDARATRVRLGGARAEEDFSVYPRRTRRELRRFRRAIAAR